MKSLIQKIHNILKEIKRKKEMERKIEELKKRDPFIYKH